MKMLLSIKACKAFTKMQCARDLDKEDFSISLPYVVLLERAKGGTRTETKEAPSGSEIIEAVPLIGAERDYPHNWAN